MTTLIWVRNGRVTTGTLCMAQAVMLHIGDVGTAYWNTVIAGHTFWTVVLGKTSTGPIITVYSRFGFVVSRKAIIIRGYRMRNRSRMDAMFHHQ
jgi:hypothetical protein